MPSLNDAKVFRRSFCQPYSRSYRRSFYDTHSMSYNKISISQLEEHAFIDIIITKEREVARKVKTYQREICPLNGCCLALRDEKDKVKLLAAASRGHRTAVSQTTCKRKEKVALNL